MRTRSAVTAAALLFALAAPAAAEESAPAADPICALIETAAKAQNLPVSFLTRLIWRESSFQPDVTSLTGAEGVAQFMPGTAAERGPIRLS